MDMCMECEPVCWDDGTYSHIQTTVPVPLRAQITVYSNDAAPTKQETLAELVAKVAEGTWKDFKLTNGSLGGKGAKFVGGVIVGGSVAAKFESHTPLKWALRGFGALPEEFTRSGAIQVFQRTTLQRALLVGKAAAAKFVLVTVAFEGGVLVGSVINQFLSEDTKEMIGGTINEVVNEGGWKLLFKHPFGIGM
jgi:hypothetical protein